MSDNVRFEVEDGVGTIRLERPPMNALSASVQADIREAAHEATARADVRAVVVYGGPKVFAAGADVKEMATWSYQEMVDRSAALQAAFTAVARIPKPTIAAITGYALGGGCELAMTCDFIIAADTARFGQPEIGLGIIPGAGGTQRLPRAIGKAKAMDMCLTGRMMDAAEAERAGLVSRVVAAERLVDEAIAAAEKIASYSRPVVMMVKETVNRSFESPLTEGLLFERRAFHSLFGTNDQREGMTAFLEKRPPQFSHG